MVLWRVLVAARRRRAGAADQGELLVDPEVLALEAERALGEEAAEHRDLLDQPVHPYLRRVHRDTRRPAVAHLVAGAEVTGFYTLAFALAGPLLGRQVDRRGPRTGLRHR